MSSAAVTARCETTSGISFSQLKLRAGPSAFSRATVLASGYVVSISAVRQASRPLSLRNHQPVLLGICLAHAIFGEPAQDGGNGLAVFHAPFDFGAGRIESPEGLRRAALAARLRAESDEAPQVALEIENVKAWNALALPDAAFAFIRIELKGLAGLEIQVGIDAGDVAGRGSTCRKAQDN